MKLSILNNLAGLAVLSNIVTWALAPMAWADVQGAIEGNAVHEDGIYVSLPVYIISLIATAGFTWTISKYDSQRNRRLEGLEAELVRSNRRSLALECRIEEMLDNATKNK